MKAIIAAAIIGIVLMFCGILVKEKKNAVTIGQVLILALFGITIWELWTTPKGAFMPLYNNMIVISRDGLWFNMLMTGCTALYLLLMGKHFKQVGAHVSEYFTLIVFILCGAFMLSSYSNLVILFIGIEVLSIPQYILAGSDKRNLKSSEAALKYFLMGSFTTGILLMGMALLYGASGTFDITEMNFIHASGVSALGISGIVLMMLAFAFKVSAVPMHQWTPDVYDGSPTAFTPFMATVVKAAAFYGFMRIFQNSFGAMNQQWVLVMAIITAATLFVGNITAVFQQSVKRMLAYSSIAQAGFMLFAVMSNNEMAIKGMILYAVAYSVATIGLFAVLIKMKDYTYDGFNGLAKKHPLLAFVTTVFLLSLTGIPLTAGFMAKYFVLQAAVSDGRLIWLVIFALVMAAVSAYYYFRLIIAMYFKTGEPELEYEVTTADKCLLAVACALIVLIGVAPGLFLHA